MSVGSIKQKAMNEFSYNFCLNKVALRQQRILR